MTLESTTPEIVRLPNGAAVIVDPAPGVSTAALTVTFRAGTINETAEQHGVAHLLEHMAFKGTTRRSAQALAEAIEGVGGSLNAATGYESTSYEARVMGEDLPLAFELLADILGEPLLDAADLEKERDVVLQEISEAADAPEDVAFDLLQAAAFGAHALGRTILGTAKSVRRQRADDLSRFMAREYAPDRMAIAVSGAVSSEAAGRLAVECFGGAETAKPRNGNPASDELRPRFIGGLRRGDRKGEQTHIAVAAPGLAVADPRLPALQVFGEIFGGGWSSRLFQRVREEKGLAYSVYSFTDAYADAGLVGAYAGIDGANAPETARMMRDILRDMAEAVTPAELARAKAMIRSGLVMGMESLEDRAEAWTADYLAYGRLVSPAEECARVDDVTADDVRAAAAAFLSSDKAIAVVGPGDADKVAEAIAG